MAGAERFKRFPFSRDGGNLLQGMVNAQEAKGQEAEMNEGISSRK